MGSSKSGPKPPEPADVAGMQKKANRDAIRYSAKVNQINQVTPFGTVTYSGKIGEDRTQTVELTPEQQAVLNSQVGIAGGLGQLGEQQLGAVGGALADPFSTQNLPGMSNGMDARNQAEAAIMGRLEPYMERDQLALENRLANQGITRGSEAYGAAMDDISRARNDARLGAVMQAGTEGQRQFGMDSALRNQMLQERLLERQQPINELAALLQGSPAISTVQPNAQPAYSMPAPDIAGLEMAKYQTQAGNQASALGGLYGLGGAGIMAAGMMA